MTDTVEIEGSSRGIEELISLLKDKGVSAGKEEGVKIIEEAEQRADWILKQAREEAAQILDKAREDADFIRNAGKESLQTAFRDIRLRLKDELSNQFASQLRELISHEMRSPDTLKHLLYCAASNTRLPDEDMDISLPEKVLGLDELRQDPTTLKQGALVEILSEVTRELLRSKITFKADSTDRQGIVFSLRNGEIIIELTEDTLTDLLLRHLQPRFRALLEGVVA